jgi:hypothetical protein
MAKTASQRQAMVGRIIDNYLRLQLLVTEVIANPTQANVDAVVTADGTGSRLKFRLDHSLDGESYNWTGYQEFLARQIEHYRKLETQLAGPYEVRTRAVSR